MVYRTTDVRDACVRTLPDSACERLAPGYLGLFCKDVPGPFSADSTLAFAEPAAATLSFLYARLGALSSASRYAAWVNRGCMPTLSEAEATLEELRALGSRDGGGEGGEGGDADGEGRESDAAAAAVQGGVASESDQGSGGGGYAEEGGGGEGAVALSNASLFAQCYHSDWWRPSVLLAAPPFNATRYPNGSTIVPSTADRPLLSRGRGRQVAPSITPARTGVTGSPRHV